MVHRWQSFISADYETGCIVLLLAAIELSALEHLLNQHRPSHARMVEVFIPQLKILDSGVQAGGSRGVEVGEVYAEGLIPAVLFVTESIVLDDLFMVIAEMGVRHPQRLKDILGCEFPQRHAADAFDDDGQKRKTGVAVHVFLAWLEVQRLLVNEYRHDVVIGDKVLRVAPASQPEKRPLIAKAAGVVKKVTKCDALTEIRQLGNLFVNIVVQRQLSLLGKQEDGCSCELFRHRGHVENGNGRNGYVIVQIRHSVAALVDDLTILVNA